MARDIYTTINTINNLEPCKDLSTTTAKNYALVLDDTSQRTMDLGINKRVKFYINEPSKEEE